MQIVYSKCTLELLHVARKVGDVAPLLRPPLKEQPDMASAVNVRLYARNRLDSVPL